MSKVIFKMTFKHPNFKNTNLKNVAHVRYIATRPGTDKTLTENDLKKELNQEIPNESENELYAKYIDERPRSHGLFGENGIEDLDKIQEEIKNHKSFVWRGIISLREEDAQKIGYLSKEKWQDLLKAKMPEVAAEMKIPLQNFRWVGAVHMEKGHPHAHVMYWEKKPQRVTGVINKRSLNKIRKVFTDEIFAEERFKYLIEKNQMRDLIRDLAKNDIGKAAKLLKEIKNERLELKAIVPEFYKASIPPRMYEDVEITLSQKLNELSEIMPQKGRIALKYMPPDVKKKAREIADYLLKQPGFINNVTTNLKAVENLTSMYTSKEEAINKAKENAYNDLRDRVAQIVLKGAVEGSKRNLLTIDQDLAEKFITKIENALKYNKEYSENFIELEQFQKSLEKLALVLYVAGKEKEEVSHIIKTFNENYKKIIPENKLEKLLEKAYKKYSENELFGKLTVVNKEDWEDIFKTLNIEQPKWIYKRKDYIRNTQNVVYRLWKTAWNSIEREKIKQEARVQIAQYKKSMEEKIKAQSQEGGDLESNDQNKEERRD